MKGQITATDMDSGGTLVRVYQETRLDKEKKDCS